MTEKANAIVELPTDQSAHITMRICSKTGGCFEKIFPVNVTTFAQVKYLAIEYLLTKPHLNELENYKLISIGSKRTIDEQKTLREERVKDGEEYFLAKKLLNETRKIEQTAETSMVDGQLIQLRTKDLPVPSTLSLSAHHLTRRTEFRTEFNRILLTLIETSQKLLWYRSDAEEIFRQVENILSKSSTPFEQIELNPSQINQLIDIGFTEKQARFALKRTKSNFNAAMELLLTEPEIDDETQNEQQTPSEPYSHHGSFITFQQFRQRYFQPNPTTIQSMKDMGFERDEIIVALRICHNDQNLACDYLLGDRRQLVNLIDAENEQGLDPNCNLFKALMDNPIIQRAVNNPKTFFVILHLYENPGLVAFYINEPEIGNLILQLSRIYYTERYRMDRSDSNENDNDYQENNTATMTDNEDSENEEN